MIDNKVTDLRLTASDKSRIVHIISPRLDSGRTARLLKLARIMLGTVIGVVWVRSRGALVWDTSQMISVVAAWMRNMPGTMSKEKGISWCLLHG